MSSKIVRKRQAVASEEALEQQRIKKRKLSPRTVIVSDILQYQDASLTHTKVMSLKDPHKFEPLKAKAIAAG